MPFEMQDNRKEGSHIRAFGFDGDKVKIEFEGGRQVVYSNVSPRMQETIVEANEMGRLGNYVAGILKPGRQFEYVEDALPRPPKDQDASDGE